MKVIIDGEEAECAVTHGPESVMIQCWCGDVFQASGMRAEIAPKQKAWEAAHADCTKEQREGRKVFWLSFCDGDKPTGEQFLGAAIVEVTAEEADAAAIEVMLRFPLAQPGAEWLAAASRKAHALGCNPG